jgi:hypothetical protein
MKYCKRCKIAGQDSETNCAKCGQPLSQFGTSAPRVPAGGRSAEPITAPAAEDAPAGPSLGNRKALVTIALGAGLTVVALVGFLVIPRGTKAPLPPTDSDSPSGTASPAAPASRSQRLAVTPAAFDDMGKLLDRLGPGYRYDVIDEEDFTRPESLGRYNAIFLSCAESFIHEAPDAPSPVARGLREYVARGGTLYASDLRFDTVAAAFPESLDRASVAQGKKQDVRADVVAPELREALGPQIPLHFVVEGWRPAAFRGEGVRVLLRGKLATTAGLNIDAPLAVLFSHGKGTVVFTSYHDEKQTSGAEADLVRYLVRKTVAARIEAKAVDLLADEGVVPRMTHTYEADPALKRIEGTFTHPQAGPLKFAMAFEGAGATIRLEVISPDGQRTVKKGDAPFTIDLPQAARGQWRYQATAEKVPSPHFPAVVLAASPGDPDRSSGKAVNTPLETGGANVAFEEISKGNTPSGPRPAPRIAVTQPQFDDMGKLLDGLGQGFRYTTVSDDVMRIPGALNQFDILFLTCDGWPASWGVTQGGSLREGVSNGVMRPDISAAVGRNLRQFVERGGTLYASDLRVDSIAYAFPDRLVPWKLNEELLPELIEAERNWFEAKVPLAKIGTVADVLKGLDLSPAVKERLDTLTLLLEETPVVGGRIGRDRSDHEQIIREILEGGRFAITKAAAKADADTIASAFRRWEDEIVNTFRARKPASLQKSQRQILLTEQHLKDLRARIRPNPNGKGNQDVRAEVVDQGLREVLGSDTLPLAFQANSWQPARFQGDRLTILLRGRYTTVEGMQAESPLLVKFPEGQGTVIFTSFHNEAQNSRQEEALLRYLVFSAVTARAEAIADETMLSGGFSPVKRSQISHAAGQPSATQVYRSESADPLRFALTFSGEGARLRFTLIAPNGRSYSKEVDSTIVIQATGAPAGEWSYTVEMIKVPYENFPFSVSIGKGVSPKHR